MDTGLGGFPSPLEIFMRFLAKLFPKLDRHIPGYHGGQDEKHPVEGSQLEYISFEAFIGRNSRFLVVSQDEIEELGGVEYRALTALLWIIPAVSSSAV